MYVKLPSEMVQNSHICIHIVQIVRVWGILLLRPAVRRWHIVIKERMFWFTLIVNRVKPNDLEYNTNIHKLVYIVFMQIK